MTEKTASAAIGRIEDSLRRAAKHRAEAERLMREATNIDAEAERIAHESFPDGDSANAALKATKSFIAHIDGAANAEISNGGTARADNAEPEAEPAAAAEGNVPADAESAESGGPEAAHEPAANATGASSPEERGSPIHGDGGSGKRTPETEAPEVADTDRTEANGPETGPTDENGDAASTGDGDDVARDDSPSRGGPDNRAGSGDATSESEKGEEESRVEVSGVNVPAHSKREAYRIRQEGLDAGADPHANRHDGPYEATTRGPYAWRRKVFLNSFDEARAALSAEELDEARAETADDSGDRNGEANPVGGGDSPTTPDAAGPESGEPTGAEADDGSPAPDDTAQPTQDDVQWDEEGPAYDDVGDAESEAAGVMNREDDSAESETVPDPEDEEDDGDFGIPSFLRDS